MYIHIYLFKYTYICIGGMYSIFMLENQLQRDILARYHGAGGRGVLVHRCATGPSFRGGCHVGNRQGGQPLLLDDFHGDFTRIKKGGLTIEKGEQINDGWLMMK